MLVYILVPLYIVHTHVHVRKCALTILVFTVKMDMATVITSDSPHLQIVYQLEMLMIASFMCVQKRQVHNIVYSLSLCAELVGTCSKT